MIDEEKLRVGPSTGVQMVIVHRNLAASRIDSEIGFIRFWKVPSAYLFDSSCISNKEQISFTQVVSGLHHLHADPTL
jgi:hypothetical protein